MYENVVKIYIYRLNIQLLILWPLLLLGGCLRCVIKLATTRELPLTTEG